MVFWRGLQYVLMDEEVLALVRLRRPAAPGRRGSLGRSLTTSRMNAYVDGWGSLWERRPDALYYEIVDSPICTATD